MKHVFMKMWSQLNNWLGNRLLELSVRLRPCEAGFVAHLQRIRQHQLKTAEIDLARTRPPSGVILTFPSFRMFEAYHAEDFDALSSSILRLFPDSDDPLTSRGFSTAFERESLRLFAGSWHHLGWIENEGGPRLLGVRHRRVLALPEGIDCIRLDLFYVLPSFYILSIDVMLTAPVSDTLHELQHRPDLGEVWFRPWMFRNIEFAGYGQTSAMAEKQKYIANWIAAMRRSVERLLHPYMAPGHFSNSKRVLSSLPCIDIFWIRGAPPVDDRPAWLESATRWLETVGFYWFRSYMNHDVCLMVDQGLRDIPNVSDYRLLVFSDEFRRENERQRPHELEGAMREKSIKLLDSLMWMLSLYRALEHQRDQIGLLRRILFRRTAKSGRIPFRFREGTMLLSQIHNAAMLLDRFGVEWRHDEAFIRSKLDDVAELRRASRTHQLPELGTLRDDLPAAIEREMKRCVDHVQTLSRWFSDQIMLLNMRASNRTQWFILLLTSLLLGLALYDAWR